MNTPADPPVLSAYLPYLISLFSLPTGYNVPALKLLEICVLLDPCPLFLNFPLFLGAIYFKQ